MTKTQKKKFIKTCMERDWVRAYVSSPEYKEWLEELKRERAEYGVIVKNGKGSFIE